MAKRVIYGSNHPGGALQNMVKEYPTVPAVLKELIQNSIDVDFGGASKIEIEVNLDDGMIRYLDNGPGLTAQTFEGAVKTFGHSTKKKDKFGRFGIGLASPLSIVENFYFVTAPSADRYRSYHFNRTKLFAVASGGYPIIEEEANYLIHGDNRTPGIRPRNVEMVWWRTGIFMSGLTEDKQKRRLDIETFVAEVQSAYGKKLVELDTKITVTVIESGTPNETTFKAKLYQGKRLPEWTRMLPDVGKVTVKLYLAPIGYLGAHRIDVGSGDNPSRVPFNKLYLTPNFYGCLSEATKTALNSKLFQGELVGENLQLLTNRKGFAQDDALFAFAVALDEWYQEVGRKYHEDEKRERQANRFQAIGLAVIERLKSSLLAPDSPYASILAQAEYGSIGKHHSSVTRSSLTGQELFGKAVDGTKKGQKGGASGDSGESSMERHNHHPKVSVGPQGNRRQVTKGHSTGFHLLTEGDIGERMFLFNRLAACLTINNTHPSFALITKVDAWIDHYYTMVIACALRLELEEDERLREAKREFCEGQISDWVSYILKA